MSKRKSGALRDHETKMAHSKKEIQSFYTNESKTIQFDTQRPKINNRIVQLVPKTVNQEKYILAILNSKIDIVIAAGPAGTGKTYLAMQAAIKAMKAGECERIILSRPAVGVDDEKHGFLPGDLNQKMEPWTKPLIDVMREYYSAKEIAHMLDEQIVEIAPLAFCRGRNFKNSYVILDESQNCTVSQMKMFLTRIGVGSKIIITGDIEQSDRLIKNNGLADLQTKLNKTQVPGMVLCELDQRDVQRHRIIPDILNLYS